MGQPESWNRIQKISRKGLPTWFVICLGSPPLCALSSICVDHSLNRYACFATATTVVPPWRQLSDSVVEHDVVGLVISIDRWVDQPILDTNGVSRVFMLDDHFPQPAATVAAIPGPPAGGWRRGGSAGGSRDYRGDAQPFPPGNAAPEELLQQVDCYSNRSGYRSNVSDRKRSGTCRLGPSRACEIGWLLRAVRAVCFVADMHKWANMWHPGVLVQRVMIACCS